MKRAFLISLLSLMGVAMIAGSAVQAQSVFTTLANGQTVNANIYNSKPQVYLNGGPQNPQSAGLTDGFYYFQVTDPSGAQLLSTDSITERALEVSGGRVAGVGASGGTHADGQFNPNDGSTGVQLIPFLDTPNAGNVYKVWLTPIQAYDLNAPQSTFGFLNSASLTDNFIVDATAPPVPEPASLILSGIGLVALLKRRRG